MRYLSDDKVLTILTNFSEKSIEIWQIAESFTVLVYGDITGDGVVDSFDYSVMPAIVNGEIDASEVIMLASDLNYDGVVDTFDIAVLSAVTVGFAEIDQTKNL